MLDPDPMPETETSLGLDPDSIGNPCIQIRIRGNTDLERSTLPPKKEKLRNFFLFFFFFFLQIRNIYFGFATSPCPACVGKKAHKGTTERRKKGTFSHLQNISCSRITNT
jgi:hypothetical protein